MSRNESNTLAGVAVSGFVMLCFAGVVLLLGVVCSGGRSLTPAQRQTSGERNARDFAQALGWEIKGVVCSGSDNESDGYVSCTFSMGGDETKPVLCGYDLQIALLGQNTSCKLANPITFQAQ